MPGSKVIKHAQAHRHITASSSQLHGWDEQELGPHISLNVLNVSGDMHVEPR
jgi:hypothetical protein